MIYGFYPEVINNPGNEEFILTSISDSMLYRDLFALGSIKKPDIMDRLLKALALQVGQEVSYNELAEITGSDKETTERYIFLLEQAFVIFRLTALSRNVRNELKNPVKFIFMTMASGIVSYQISNNFH